MPRTTTQPLLTMLAFVSPWVLCGLLLVGATPVLAQDEEDDPDDEQASQIQDSEDESEKKDSDEGEESEKKDSDEEDSDEDNSDEDDSDDSKGSKTLPELIPEPEDSDAPPLPEPDAGDVKACQLRGDAPLSPILGLSTLLLLAPLRTRRS